MKRHHNNKGYRQVKRGKTAKSLKAIARRLGLPFRAKKGFKMIEKFGG